MANHSRHCPLDSGPIQAAAVPRTHPSRPGSATRFSGCFARLDGLCGHDGIDGFAKPEVEPGWVSGTRTEPPIGRLRMPRGGARLMHQAAKRAGARRRPRSAIPGSASPGAPAEVHPAAVDRPIRSATGVHCSAFGLMPIAAIAPWRTHAVSPGWAGEPGWLDVEPNDDAAGSCQGRAGDPSPASTPAPTGQVRSVDFRALARALVAAALAAHGQPTSSRTVVGRLTVAGSARWRFHPPGQRNTENEGGCDRG
jgi:hypothetical protein